MDVRFSAALVMGRNFLTPGHLGARVRNVHRKSGPKNLCLRCFFFSDSEVINRLVIETFIYCYRTPDPGRVSEGGVSEASLKGF